MSCNINPQNTQYFNYCNIYANLYHTEIDEDEDEQYLCDSYELSCTIPKFSKKQQKRSPWYQRLFKRDRIVATASSWQRDLTRECVESNPGPFNPFDPRSTPLPPGEKHFTFKSFTFPDFQKLNLGTKFNNIFQSNYMLSQNPLQAKFTELAKEYASITSFVESLLILTYQLIHARSTTEKNIAILNYAKHIDPKGSIIFGETSQMLLGFAEITFAVVLQSDEDNKPAVTMRDLIDQYEHVRDSELVKKLYTFCMYALSLSLFDKIGITMSNLQFTHLEQEATKRNFKMGPSFIHCLLDTSVFLVERGQQYLRTGKMSSILHSGAQYSEWFTATHKLRTQSQFLSNPEPHGFTQFSYQSDLTDAIDRGASIVEHAKSSGNKPMLEKTRNILNDLKLQKAHLISKKSASQSREAPFAVLVSGGSSVAKSTFVSMLIHHFGEIMNLPHGDEYVHTRNYMDEYFVNFTSAQWCVVLDDIALFNPNKAPQGDPSLCEIIQIVNSISFNPTQAALEDKGKTPMLAKFVVATTNTPDLNAQHYFSCPLAVRRRLPYTIDIKPKECYSKHGCMLDGSKVPPVEEGEYPNYWDIEVSQVIPDKLHKSTHKQAASSEIIYKTDDIYEFMEWFTEKAKSFRTIQDKETACKKNFTGVKLCKSCFKLEQRCDCVPIEMQAHSAEIEVNPRIDYILDRRARARFDQNLDRIAELDTRLSLFEYCILGVIWLYYKSYFVNCLLRCLFGQCFIGCFVMKYCTSAMLVHVYYLYGEDVYARIGMSSKFRYLRYACVGIASGLLLSIVMKMFKKDDTEKDEVRKEQVYTVKKQTVDFTGIGQEAKPREDERDNVWYKDPYVTTSFDVPQCSLSAVGIPIRETLERLGKNMVYVKLRVTYEKSWKTAESSGFCTGGHTYVFNNHLFPSLEGVSDITITSRRDSGVDQTISVKLTEADLQRVPDRDSVFVELLCLPPRKDISKYFPKNTLRGIHKCYYITMSEDGDISYNLVENVQLTNMNIRGEFNGNLDLWVGKPKSITRKGDCGSMLVSDSPMGPIILGFHAMFDEVNKNSMAIPLWDHDMHCLKLLFGTPVNSGTPNLDLPDKKTVVGELHSKSVFRYLEDGVANVHGSLAGFRPKHKSRVQLSVVARNLMSKGWKLKHGAPVMKGWAPWRIAAQDMIKPVTKMNLNLLKQCGAAMFDDIMRKLPEGELAYVHVLPDDTAINGAPGIAYLDKINRSTSAGFPWKKSKKHLMHPVSSNSEIVDEYDITDEVKERVSDCIAKYERCERYMPVFTAHLKDEALPFKKIAAEKTRVFTGAPLDYTIVVRKYLLSVIRLMQNNRFIFECGPGTIAQSLEWQEIGKFITKFGKDRMIAGDYKSFDKSMPPCVIIEAYKIIIRICHAAGYSEKELNVVRTIAEDTAFPLVDFNGDLVEFYGSNPSGHPLTVIINGLANSLYLRYVYATLSPDGSAKHFQDHVAVMTYGDDNVMGVSKDISFFTHTSIVNVLANVGITYTMADKEAESVPFLHIDQVSFLKRTWRFDPDIGATVAPLEEDSIEKMVLIGVASKTIVPEAQAIATMSSAMREYFWYGKEKFHEKRAIFAQVIEEEELTSYVEDATFPEWDELKKQFWLASKHVAL